MNDNYSPKRQFANVLRKTPLYPTVKTLYRYTLNRNYVLQRRELINFFSAFVKTDDLVFDVGANLGDFVDAFLHLGARVCAVEPNPFCVEELKSLYSNHYNRRLFVIEHALGPSEGEGTMYLGGQGMHTVSTLSETWKDEAKKQPSLSKAGWENQMKVGINTLDQLIREYGVPKFCKIDVEGFEYEVLKGLTQPLPMISLEYTPWRLDPTILCIEYLSGLGTHEFNITMSKSREIVGKLHFQDWVDKNQIIDLLNKEIRNTDTVGDLYVRAIS